MIALDLAAALLALLQDGSGYGAAEAEIVAETLPTVEEIAFPELSGDFDGDDREDSATARQDNRGVQIALSLSSAETVFVEPLGADALSRVTWNVVPAADQEELCGAPACGLPQPPRDAIMVTIAGGDSFLLVWQDGALETIFID